MRAASGSMTTPRRFIRPARFSSWANPADDKRMT
jgi:hypothetical protein